MITIPRIFLLALAASACRPGAADDRATFAAASGVKRADSGKSPRDARIIPLGPMAGDAELLYGDPEVPGEPFVMRIRELPGTVVPPHSHPVDEHITVVQGTWYFGLGDVFDSSTLRPMPAGTYAFAPQGASMFGYTPDSAIVQVHGIGPFHIHWRDSLRTLDDPAAPETFRYRRGDRVATPRGTGIIRQGYASGRVVQYEIELPGGRSFMAHQRDVRRP